MTICRMNPMVASAVRVRAVIAAMIIIMTTLAMTAGSKAQTALPEISVSPPAQPPQLGNQFDHKDGGDGKVGAGMKGESDRALEQINRRLKHKVDETNPVLNNPPFDARSPGPKTGVINIPGVAQQYGKNFGNSVVPYRPTIAPAPPLGHR